MPGTATTPLTTLVSPGTDRWLKDSKLLMLMQEPEGSAFKDAVDSPECNESRSSDVLFESSLARKRSVVVCWTSHGG